VGLPIGVVTGAQGQRWYEVTVTGQEAHAGPTPVPRRRDALVGAARMIDLVNRIGLAHAPYACATLGFVQVSPNSRNTISDRVFSTVDFRHPEDEVLSLMDRDLRQACEGAASAIGLQVEVKEVLVFPGDLFHPDLVAAVRNAAAAQGYHIRTLSAAPGTTPSICARSSDCDGVCAVRRRHQPQRDRGRQARGSDRRLQRAAECLARRGECHFTRREEQEASPANRRRGSSPGEHQRMADAGHRCGEHSCSNAGLRRYSRSLFAIIALIG
jgi:hypothetical protein